MITRTLPRTSSRRAGVWNTSNIFRRHPRSEYIFVYRRVENTGNYARGSHMIAIRVAHPNRIRPANRMDALRTSSSPAPIESRAGFRENNRSGHQLRSRHLGDVGLFTYIFTEKKCGTTDRDMIDGPVPFHTSSDRGLQRTIGITGGTAAQGASGTPTSSRHLPYCRCRRQRSNPARGRP